MGEYVDENSVRTSMALYHLLALFENIAFPLPQLLRVQQ